MQEDIKYIIGQTGVSEQDAINAYDIEKDVVNAILRLLYPKNEELRKVKKFSVDIAPENKHQKKIAELREIMKDTENLLCNMEDSGEKITIEDEETENKQEIDLKNHQYVIKEMTEIKHSTSIQKI
jgi:hypothetical protein